MAYSVNWTTKLITIPQSDLTLISGSIYSLNVNDLRLKIRALEYSEDGIIFSLGISNPDGIVKHTEPTTVAGVTLARVVEIINGFTVQFEDGQYAVNIIGGNSNVADVIVRNQVSISTANSSGFIQGSSGMQDAKIVQIGDDVITSIADIKTNIGPLL